MLLNRRSVPASALAPLVPAAGASNEELLALGAQLEVLLRRAAALRQAGIEGVGWSLWNKAVVASEIVAQRNGRAPAHDLAGFALKLEALACEWDGDLEDHQLRRLCALARDIERAA